MRVLKKEKSLFNFTFYDGFNKAFFELLKYARHSRTDIKRVSDERSFGTLLSDNVTLFKIDNFTI